MQFEGALITEQGITFAIICVKPSVLYRNDKEKIRQYFSSFFGNVPTVFMAQNRRGIPTYHGRRDIVSFLSHIPLSSIPWKHFTAA